jgi:sortase B
MDNLVFKISGDMFIASTSNKTTDPEKLNNTNVIDTNDLKFSPKYITHNMELVVSFLNVVVLKNNITKVQINNMDIATLVTKVAVQLSNIQELIYKPDKELKYDTFLEILSSKNIKKINCYQLKAYLLERIDLNTPIKVTTRSKINNVSDFMRINDLNTYSDIFYKKSIILPDNIDRLEEIDIDNFLSINDKIKVIRIKKYKNTTLTFIVEKLIRHHEHNLTILIDEEGNDLNTIYSSVSYLKKAFKKFFDRTKINFKVNYSKEYKKQYFLKEMNLKMFATIILLAAIVVSGVFIYKSFDQENDETKAKQTQKELINILNLNGEQEQSEQQTMDIEYITERYNETSGAPVYYHYETPSYLKAYKTDYTKVFDELKQMNPDTIGWLKVNNTSISYPVVQSVDNYYYLSHDFNQSNNSMGWVFSDYRNSFDELDQNTIIYGHNTKYGVIFGTMRKAFYKSWYNNPKNMIITFNTPKANMKWQIFAMYEVPETNDYLTTVFEGDEFINFTNMLKSRSVKDFGVQLNANDKILTLSTCHKHTTRQVIHAKLVEYEEIKQPEPTPEPTPEPNTSELTTEITTTEKIEE